MFITVSTIITTNTITMRIISDFIQAVILQHMFVNKGKINISRFFPMLHYEESPEKLQYNMVTHPFLDRPLILS